MLKIDYGNKPIKNTTHILVIDSNILLIDLLEKSLVQDDVKITSVTNMKDATKLLKEQIFDVVLWDGPIDNHSKETIMEIFEQNNFLQDQKIVLFSGIIQPDFIEKWTRKGLYGYIEKPTSKKRILEFLQSTKNDPNSKKKINSQTNHEQDQVKYNIEQVKEDEEEATPEQLAKVEELTKQIEELESQTAKSTSSTESIHKEEIKLKSVEQVKEDEEEATPEQLAKVEELTKQIEELESQTAKSTSSTESIHKEEIKLKSVEQVKEDEEEATPEQLAKVEELTKQIEELESQTAKSTSSTESIHKEEINHLMTSKVSKISSNTLKDKFPQTMFETQTNSEFKSILDKLASIKNQFLYNTSNVPHIGHTQTTEEIFNLKKEITKIRRKVYRTRQKQKHSKSKSTQNKKTRKQRVSKKKI